MPSFTECLDPIQWKGSVLHWLLLRRIPFPRLRSNSLIQSLSMAWDLNLLSFLWFLDASVDSLSHGLLPFLTFHCDFDDIMVWQWQNTQTSREGGVCEGGVAEICREIAHQICARLSVFRSCASEEGCTKLPQNWRKVEDQFRTMLCEYPFSNAPFSALLLKHKARQAFLMGNGPESSLQSWQGWAQLFKNVLGA